MLRSAALLILDPPTLDATQLSMARTIEHSHDTALLVECGACGSQSRRRARSCRDEA